jgi:ElaB/YqjD/DUF883 family membrane-anchored ribosome-binding protein
MASHERSTGTARAWKDSAPDLQDITQRAQDAAAQATGYVKQTYERADQAIADATGKPLASWGSDTASYVRTHPLQSALIALAVGYVVGKLLKRS